MSESTHVSQVLHLSTLFSKLVLALVAMLTGIAISSAVHDTSLPAHRLVAAPAEDDEVVLPSRISAAIQRTTESVQRAQAAIDDRRMPAARASLRASAENVRRAHRAGMRQLTAAPVDEEAETTTGPDSVVAVLTLEQTVATQLSGLFDNVRAPRVVAGIGTALNTALKTRNTMLHAVTGLDPEGAGADYADGMADTVDGYADEIATLTEAIKFDRLTPPARTILTKARALSRTAQAKVNAAFGGGE